MTQAGLSRASGVTERTIRRVEGGSKPSFDTLDALASALRVTSADLLFAIGRTQRERRHKEPA